MHSRIFQITTNPVQDEDYISEYGFFEHWFVGAIADYVNAHNDQAEDIKYLRSWLEANKVAAFDESGDSFTVLPGGREAYFTRAYDTFVAARAKTFSMSLSDFASAGEFGGAMWQMSNSFNDKFAYYVSSDEFDTISFDEFIRSSETEKRYYIGGTLDYHF